MSFKRRLLRRLRAIERVAHQRGKASVGAKLLRPYMYVLTVLCLLVSSLAVHYNDFTSIINYNNKYTMYLNICKQMLKEGVDAH